MAGGARARSAVKVNLHLGVGPLQPDGYHPVLTILQSLDWGDDLELWPAPPGQISLELRGDVVVPAGSENLVHRAMTMALEEATHAGADPTGAHITLSKRVPAGAGLGGGSGDAGAALLLMDGALGLGLGRRRLLAVARRLGADVPFFLAGGLAVGRGRGDRLRQLAPLPELHAVLAVPPVALSTARVYQWFDEQSLTSGGDGFRMRPALERLRKGRALEAFYNDLQGAVFSRHPELAGVHQSLCAMGALAAGLSGSGSVVFGLFREPAELDGPLQAWRKRGWEIRCCRTLSGPAYRARFGSAALRD